jgi:hypothetical protein
MGVVRATVRLGYVPKGDSPFRYLARALLTTSLCGHKKSSLCLSVLLSVVVVNGYQRTNDDDRGSWS